MNKIIISGGLGKDAELSFIQGSGKALLKFSVAVNKGFKKEDGTNWFNCVMFGERGEKLAQYLVKGTKVIIEGSINLGTYDAKDGTKHYTTDLYVNNVEMIGGKKEENTSQDDEITPINDQDIPF
ncbi:single-stranded DNA-binding protein [Clostridium sp.]